MHLPCACSATLHQLPHATGRPPLAGSDQLSSINRTAIVDLIREADLLGTLRHPNIVSTASAGLSCCYPRCLCPSCLIPASPLPLRCCCCCVMWPTTRCGCTALCCPQCQSSTARARSRAWAAAPAGAAAVPRPRCPVAAPLTVLWLAPLLRRQPCKRWRNREQKCQRHWGQGTSRRPPPRAATVAAAAAVTSWRPLRGGCAGVACSRESCARLRW